MDPKVVVLGEAPSQNLYYYRDYDTVTQNSAGSICFECEAGWVDLYVGSSTHSVDFLEDEDGDTYDNYIGSLCV